jgi:hypothetical protein
MATHAPAQQLLRPLSRSISVIIAAMQYYRALVCAEIVRSDCMKSGDINWTHPCVVPAIVKFITRIQNINSTHMKY